MADIAKTVSDLEEFKRNLNAVGDFYEETLVGDAIELLKSQQKEIERLCNKIGVMKESIEDAIMSETVFDTFDDLSSYVNAERCRSEEWTGGIRDAIQAVRAWGE